MKLEFSSTISIYVVFQAQENSPFSLWLFVFSFHGYYPDPPGSSTNSNSMLSFSSFLLFFLGNGEAGMPNYLQNTDRKQNTMLSVDYTQLPSSQAI